MPTSPRLLILTTDLERGGTPIVVRDLAVRIAPPDRVEVACLAVWGPVATEMRDRGIRVTALGARGPLDLRVIGRLRRLMRDGAFDVVYSLLVHANVAAALATRGLPGVRVIQSIQTTQPWPRWHWPTQRVAAAAAERVVVPSESVARVAREWARVPPGKLVVIPNAVDADAYPRSTAPPHRVGFLGRLDPVKRVPDLVAAVARVPGVTLDVFGEGDDRARIEAAIAAAGVGDRVRLRGVVARPQDALAEIGTLVLPSAAEGFGLVLIEAMAAGVPVIGTDVDGIRDVVQHDVNGLLVPPGDVPALASAIARLRDDATLRARLIETGSRVVRERYAWRAVLPKYRTVLGV